jgi:predicted nucleotidyltransferase
MTILKVQELFKALIDAKVKFLLVGGFAGIGHGMNYLTEDLDVCYERTPENFKAIIKALAPLKPRLRIPGGELPFLFDEKTLKNGLNFTLETEAGPIDLLGEIPGVGTYKECSINAVSYEFYGMAIPTLSLEDLIQAKKAANRAKDQLHLMELEAIRELQRKNK